MKPTPLTIGEKIMLSICLFVIGILTAESVYAMEPMQQLYFFRYVAETIIFSIIWCNARELKRKQHPEVHSHVG